MIAVDTNVLVYAHVSGFAQHETAQAALRELAEGSQTWGIPAPCLSEFLRIVTHPRVLEDPYGLDEALAALDAVLASPSLAVLCPADQHGPWLASSARQMGARGNLAFDAALAAICLENGVTELLTEDRDFDRLDDLRIRRLTPGD